MTDPDHAPKSANSKGLTAIVAGGAGFIGSHLCETLLNQNINVICVDNLVSGSKENIKHLLTNPNFSFLNYDLNSSPLQLSEGLLIDYIFHVASVTSLSEEKDLSLEALLVNSLGTKYLLDLAVEKQAKFLLVSAADIYGGALSSSSLYIYFGRHKTESQLLSQHEANRYAEALTVEYFRKYQLDARICRVMDVYGPRMNLKGRGILNKLLHEAFLGDRITVEGDGLKTLHPTFVGDVVYGLVRAILLENTKGKIFSLVAPTKTTILAFIEEMKKAFGKEFGLQLKRGDDLDISFQHVDLSSANGDLNWKPKVAIVDGLIQTIESYRHAPVAVPIVHEYNPALPSRTPFRLKLPVIKLPSISIPRGVLTKSIGPRSHLRFVVFLASLLLLLIGVFYPTTSFFLNSSAGKSSLTAVQRHLENSDLPAALVAAKRAENAFKTAQQDIANLHWLITMLQWRQQASETEQTLFALQQLAAAMRYGLEGAEPVSNLLKNLNTNIGANILTSLDGSDVGLTTGLEKTLVAEATLYDLERKNARSLSPSELASFKQGITQAKEFLNSLRTVYEILPEALGAEGVKNYLLLEVDSTVTTAVGGKVEKFLLLTFDNGRVSKSKVGKVGDLSAEVPSLADYRTLTRRTTTTLMESFWEVDLPTSLQPLLNYFSAQGDRIDGVFLFNQKLATQLTDHVGKSVSLDTIDQVVLGFSQADWFKTFKVVKRVLESREGAMVYYKEPIQSILKSIGWEGSVRSEKVIPETLVERNETVVADYLQFALAGFDAAKTTVEQSIAHQVSLNRTGLLQSVVTVSLRNVSSQTFTGYGRLLVPVGSILESAKVTDRNERLVEQKFGKTQFGLPLTIRSGEELTLEFTYQLALQLSGEKTYSVLVQKPLGDDLVNYQLVFQLPSGYVASGNSFRKADTSYVASGQLTSDRYFTLKITPP